MLTLFAIYRTSVPSKSKIYALSKRTSVSKNNLLSYRKIKPLIIETTFRLLKHLEIRPKILGSVGRRVQDAV